MYLKVLAFDYDGTLAADDVVAAETWAALQRLKAAGFRLLLVTGRILSTLPIDGYVRELFDAVVAEDGAVVYFPKRERISLPFGLLTPELTSRLATLGVPLEHGMAIVATWLPHDRVIADLLQELGGGATIEYNRGAVMVLPPGATKGSGLLYALAELGLSPRNVVACGDAENDLSLFQVSELAVAVANTPDSIRVHADIVAPEANGAGVRWLVHELLHGDLPRSSNRPERLLALGTRSDGSRLELEPATLLKRNLGITGASQSGKSWLAGMMLEQLLEHGYQVCVIDPEGDYGGLRALPRTLVLGGPDNKLPDVDHIVTISDYSGVSLILDFSQYTVGAKADYVADLLPALTAMRTQRGRPHWILIDEVQNFCPQGETALTPVLLDAMSHGGVALVGYRPSKVHASILAAVDHWLVARTRLTEEIDMVAKLVSSCHEEGVSAMMSLLPQLPQGEAFLCLAGERPGASSRQEPVGFRAQTRTVSHVRHLQKYLMAPLAANKRFYFRDESGNSYGQASSLWEFHKVLETVPISSLHYHLQRGDIAAWLKEVLHERGLAQQVAKMSHRELRGELLRQTLLEVVGHRYDELLSLA